MAQKRTTDGRKGAGVVSSSKGSKKPFYTLIAVAAIAGIATLSYMSSQAGKNRIIALDPNLPPVTSQGYVLGSPTAPIELIEFGDFECPSCANFAQLTEPDIRAQYVNTGKVRFRFIDFPLGIHRNTLNASNAAACADEQGKFWEMHDLIFATQHEWNGQVSTNPDKHMKELGRRISGLDGGKLDECIDSRRMLPKIQSHLKLGVDRGANGTPTFVVGSNIINLPRNAFDEFQRYFDGLLAKGDTTKASAKKP